MIYAFMKEHSSEFEIAKMAHIFKVSRAGYYKSISRKESKTKRDNNDLVVKIKSIHKESRETYGSPRIYKVLKKAGLVCSRRRVSRLMRSNKIQAKMRKKWKASDKRCTDPTRIAPNIVNQVFSAPSPNIVWASDITYIWTTEGWLYVATIMDLFSRKIVGLAMGDQIDTNLIKRALAQAICHRKPRPGLVLHSDRGSQYTSHEYKKITLVGEIRLSMSAKGYCYDNAAMESFYHTLKTEHTYFHKYQTRKEAAQSIFEYIEVFYNRQRMHSTLDYQSPEEFEKQHEMQYQYLQIGAVG
jgi:transposase InsO family protein